MDAAFGTIRAGPFELEYLVEGTGPSVLVVGSARYYARVFPPALRERLRLAFVDHRGFGQPRAPYGPADYTLDTVVDDVEAVRQRLGLGRVVAVGHSGHGYLAIEYAKRYPAHVTHAVLVATGPSHAPEHTALADRHWAEAVCPDRRARHDRDMAGLDAAIAADPGRRFVAFCLAAAARSWADPAFDAAPLWEGVRVNMDVVDHLWGEAFRDLDVRVGLAALDAPVLLAVGRLDYLVAPVASWEPYRDAFRDLTVRVFEASGHTPPLEEAGPFADVFLGWLADHPVPLTIPSEGTLI